ncbi:MAG: GNAT family N-acetyltransferase [Rhodocyclales bacterium RIFCSPLOWO2_02_FULL_63_24]|nr:MAG: GNAT family N-acetyltransferase [Rhodocyclales bacterium RIFCSPLOWO2_02_FULL_63_24]
MSEPSPRVGAGNAAASVRELGAGDVAELEQVRQFFRNYAAWLGVDLCFQNFDEEMATLPGRYGAPAGRLFYAEVDAAGETRGAGCVGIRPFAEGVCELKRLYVDPAARGLGIGRQLALAAIRAAREIGYRKILLDTLPAMRIAVKLYRELGFLEAPAYYQTPVEGTQFLALDLENWSEEQINNQTLHHLFDFNRAWARRITEVDPDYFERLSHLQAPEYLWIGCSDSRVPANQIVGLLPGEVFVHRNVANIVVHTDLNCLSVIQFAIDVLKVRHIMVVGHYGCGGVQAALKHQRVGLADLWLRHVQDVHVKHLARVDELPEDRRHDRLCELNVLEQVINVSRTIVVQDAWQRGQGLTIHGWIYGLKDGLVRDLGLTISAPNHIAERYELALSTLP